VVATQRYFYRVAPTGAEYATRQIKAIAGLPRNWAQSSYGEVFPPGSTNVGEDTFIVQAYGTHPFGHSHELYFVHSALTGDEVLTGRLRPLLASQVTTVGLMLRTEDSTDRSMVALSQYRR